MTERAISWAFLRPFGDSYESMVEPLVTRSTERKAFTSLGGGGVPGKRRESVHLLERRKTRPARG